ncbi:MAG: LamG-like jellyroll fold domain-containing protein, partial [Bacteroidota bacterium]
RYLPTFEAGNPKTGEDHRNIVDEIFTIYKNGHVLRKIKQGDASYENWEDPLNVRVQTFDLSSSGIINVNIVPGTLSTPRGPIAGNTVLGPNVITPSAWWKFDAAQGNRVTESMSGYSQAVGGHKTNWKKGVSGTALALDGYNTFITLPNSSMPALSAAVTVEAWIAVGAYPWFDQGIVHKGNGGALDGFGLYLDEFGEIFGLVEEGGGGTTTVFGGAPLPLRQWSHVALVIDPANGVMKLFINGQEQGDEQIEIQSLQIGNGDIHIGSGLADANWFYTQDALIDEVRIYNSALTNSEILQSYNNFNPGASILTNADLEQRIIPEGTSTGQFGVRYERLPFYDTWDQLFRDGPYSDIVIGYDNSPVKTVFWRGASYSPFHTNGAKVRFNSEFNENFGPDGANTDCCYEPMSDKQHLYSHARVVENKPARVVIHWRYSQLFPNHRVNHFNSGTGWGDWSDWYMYCYPDGMTAYEMIRWTNDTENFVEWAEPMLLLGPEERPTNIVPFTNTVTNYTQTITINWDWSTDWNTLDLLHNSGPKPEVQTINTTGSAYRPVMVYDTPNLEFWGPYNDFNRYNHWPVGQKPTAGSDDYQTSSRTAHTAMLKPIPNNEGYQSGTITNGGWKKHLRLEGMSNRDATSLRRLYRSWQQAPSLSNPVNVSGSYSLEQRAFQLTAAGSRLSFKVDASLARPLDNPCFIVKNWCGSEAQVLVNGATAPNGVRQGVFTDTDGTSSLAIYLEMVSTSSIEFEISCDPITTSLEELEDKTKITLWPNPSSNEVTIVSDEPVVGYRIFDISGKQIKQLSSAENNIVNVNLLPAGMYILEVFTTQGKTPLKFIKK